MALPDGKRVAVWVIVNIENWNIEEPMPRTVLSPPGGQTHIPDIPQLVVAGIRHAGRILAAP